MAAYHRGLTACTLGSVPGPMLDVEYGKPLCSVPILPETAKRKHWAQLPQHQQAGQLHLTHKVAYDTNPAADASLSGCGMHSRLGKSCCNTCHPRCRSEVNCISAIDCLLLLISHVIFVCRSDISEWHVLFHHLFVSVNAVCCDFLFTNINQNIKQYFAWCWQCWIKTSWALAHGRK